MIHHYKVCMAGPYHQDQGIPCQDACHVKDGKDGMIAAAVADGLGSVPFADVGSSIAAREAVEYCAGQLSGNLSSEEIKDIMALGFENAYRSVFLRAQTDGNPDEFYDTTLCMAIYDSHSRRLYYGQAGDSGIVALLEDGTYKKITTQQRDRYGCVYPLSFGPDNWVFGEEEAVASVMLMTDGVWDCICPPVMKQCEIDINISLAKCFLDHNSGSRDEIALLEEESCRYLERFPREILDDDKTILVLLNSESIPARREDRYYHSPDWTALYQNAKKNLYAADSGELPGHK